MLNRLRTLRGNGRDRNDSDLALNLSFVLHEPSTSRAIRSAVRAVRTHEQRVTQIATVEPNGIVISNERPDEVEYWISARIGVPRLLPVALGVPPDQVVLVDADLTKTSPARFFRADASLVLPPESTRRVGVAALVLRPDRQTMHLNLSGVFDWPAECEPALRALERIIQAHVSQWMPGRPLWPATAEFLLPDEVYLGSDDASRMS